MSLLLRHVSRSIRCGSRLTAHGNARAAQYTPRTRPRVAVPPRTRYVTPGRRQQSSRTCRFALRQLVPQRTPHVDAPAESPLDGPAGHACRVAAYPTPPKCRAGTPLASTYAAPSVARTPGRRSWGLSCVRDPPLRSSASPDVAGSAASRSCP